jgi:metallo-beta-lactamase class B
LLIPNKLGRNLMSNKLKFLFLVTCCLWFTASVGCQSDDDIKLGIAPVEPFRIAGNIYYVGSNDLTSYLIVTKKGSILIDSGMKEMVPQVKTNVQKLGFKLSDIKIILNSHAHFDHAGGIAELRRMTGAKFIASELDAPLLERGGKDDPNFGDKYVFEPTKPDETFVSGKHVSLAGTTLTAHVTSGHTKGCTTWTTKVRDRGLDLNVIFVCSVSSPGYRLIGNRKYPEIEQDYISSFSWWEHQKVDVFLGSHAGFFDLEGKAKLQRSGAKINPFIDPKGYREFIENNKKAFTEKLKTQRSASQ